MENRDRDKVSRSEAPSEKRDINRDVSSRRGDEESSSEPAFGENIGESEDLEPGSRHRGSRADIDH